MKNEADKAELIQSIRAYYIPSSLFIATLINAAGIFLVYNGYSLGFGLLALGVTVIASAITFFVRFQNKLRVSGQIARAEDGRVLDESPAQAIDANSRQPAGKDMETVS